MAPCSTTVFVFGLAAIAGVALAFDAPRLERITVDGNAGDWGDRGLRVDRLAQHAAAGTTVTPAADGRISLRDMDGEAGWLGDAKTFAVAPAKQSKSGRAWLSSPYVASLWRLLNTKSSGGIGIPDILAAIEGCGYTEQESKNIPRKVPVHGGFGPTRSGGGVEANQ